MIRRSILGIMILIGDVCIASDDGALVVSLKRQQEPEENDRKSNKIQSKKPKIMQDEDERSVLKKIRENTGIHALTLSNPSLVSLQELFSYVQRYEILRKSKVDMIHAIPSLVISMTDDVHDLEKFLAQGVPVDQIGNSGTALTEVTFWHNKHKFARCLLDHKACIDYVDGFNSDALMWALSSPKKLSIAQLIVDDVRMSAIINRKVSPTPTARVCSYLRSAIEARLKWGRKSAYFKEDDRYPEIIQKLIDRGSVVTCDDIVLSMCTDSKAYPSSFEILYPHITNTIIQEYIKWLEEPSSFDSENDEKIALDRKVLLGKVLGDLRVQYKAALENHLVPVLTEIVCGYLDV